MSAPDPMAKAGAAQSDRAPSDNSSDGGTATPCSSGDPFGYQFASVISNGPPPLVSYGYDFPRSAHAKRSPDFSSEIQNSKILAKPNSLSMGNRTSATHQRGAGVPPALIKTHTWGTDLSGSLQGAGGVGGLLMAEEMTGPKSWIFTNTRIRSFYVGETFVIESIS